MHSLYVVGVLTVVESNLEQYRIAITAIQEIRWIREGNLKLKKCTVFYSDGQRHERGIGFIINNKYLEYIKRFTPYSDKPYYIQLECKHMNIIIIVNGYAPTENKQQDEKKHSMKI